MGSVRTASRMSLPRKLRRARRNPNAVPIRPIRTVAILTTNSDNLSVSQIMNYREGRKSYFSIIVCPELLSTRSMNSRASTSAPAPLITAIG